LLNNIDFNKLKVFYRIYQNKSMIAAAKELNVTPSAVSQHLKKLEADMGVHLFTRMHKKLVPTVEAETLFRILTPFIHELEAGLRDFRRGKRAPSGLLRIGVPVEFGKIHFPGIIAAFREIYPAVTFSLILGNSDKLLEMVKTGDLEFAVADLFISQRQYVSELGIFHVEPIVDEEVVLACSSAYYDRHLKEDLSLATILARDFISYDHSMLALRGWFRHHFGKQSVRLNTVLTVDSVQAVLAAIRNGIGLGIVTCHMIRDQALEEEIIPVKTGKEEIINKISLIQLQDKIPNFTEKTFRRYMKQRLKRLERPKKE
jgi:DNA-binding transcriptional LysR family regulator